MSRLRIILRAARRASLLLAACFLALPTAQAQKNKRPTSYNYLRGVEAFENEEWQDAASYFVEELKENEHNGYAIGYLGQINAAFERLGPALTLYSEALKYVPEKDKEFTAQIHDWRGRVYWMLGDTLKAMQEAEEATRNDARNAVYSLDLAALHWHHGDFADAERLMKQAYRLDTTEVDAADYLASFYEDQKRYGEAYDWARRTIEMDSTRASAYMTACRSAYFQKHYADAARMLSTAFRTDADYAYSFVDSVARADYDAAAEAFRAAIRQYPDNTSLHTGLCAVNFSTNRLASALKNAKESAAQTDDVAALVVAASVAMGAHLVSEAEELNNQAFARDSANYNVREQKAELLIRTGNPAESIPILDALVEAQPQEGEYYHLRASAMRYAGREAEALRDAEYAAALSSDQASYQLTYGRLLLRSGQKEKAEAYLQRVVEIDTMPDGGQSRMLALAYLRREKEAVALCDSILRRENEMTARGRIVQSDPQVYYDAASLYALLGQNARALQYLKRAFELNYRAFFFLGRNEAFESLRKEQAYRELVETYRDKPVQWQ